MRRKGCPVGTIRINGECKPLKKNLKPMMCWYGGKSRVAKEIVKKIPPHKTYIEPFVGGGVSILKRNLRLITM